MPKRKGTFALSMGFFFGVCLLGLMPMLVRAQATGSISGRVTDAGNAGILNVEVRVFDMGETLRGSDLTDAAGDYAIDGLPAGTYKICYFPNGLNYLYEWYSDKISFLQGDPVVISAGQIMSNIDAQLVTAGRISGKVTDEFGAAIQNIKVVLYTRYAWGYPFDVQAGTTLTDAAGEYTFVGLAAPQYAVKYEGNGLNYFSEWYNDKPSASEADPISVPLGGHNSDVDASLKTGGRISGRVTDSAGEGIENIQVEALYENGAQDFYTETDADGNYSFLLLPAGTYRLHFDNRGLNYFSEWYSDKNNAETADPVVLAEGGLTTDINAQLTTGGIISGRVTDQSGNGISQGSVTAFFPDYGWAGSSSTEANGSYTISHLPSGNYKVYFEGNVSPGFVPEWYNEQAGFETADSVAVTVENTTSNIDAQLTAMGRISGRISLLSGTGIEGILVEAFNAGSQIVISTTLSNSNGEYVVENLPAGLYKLKFGDYRHISEWYDNKASFQSADQIAVTSGEATENINAQLTKRTTLDLTKDFFNFSATRNGSVTPADSTILSNSGTGTLNWTATPAENWISVSPASGAGNGVISIGISRTDLEAGTYYGSIRIADPVAWNSPRDITVVLRVFEQGTDTEPFGSFDTPGNGGPLSSSIPVTGWALDDIGVASVKIYGGTGLSDRIFIGDATCVEGARPDIENIYCEYPQSDRAGWGYMLLTNFLPNGGNGTFTLLAYATDTEGHEVLLGSKTIVCDNANGVKPFGAIDTPVQGGTASGRSYLNFGWVLTPQPNSIPIDGSTLNVWVDGLPLGHPVYNNYRADIATLFPGYANSNGAVGVFSLDTTGYSNGLHTIEWSATDSGGNTDGIGSRYFTVQNLGSAPESAARVSPLWREAAQEKAIDQTVGSKARGRSGLAPTGQPVNTERGESQASATRSAPRNISEIAALPEDIRTPVYVKRGAALNAPTEMISPEDDGMVRLSVPQVTRLAVYLNESDAGETEAEMIEHGRRIRNGFDMSEGSDASGDERIESQSKGRERGVYSDGRESRMSSRSPVSPDLRMESRSSARYEAYQIVGEELRPLPIGSSFDPGTGAFYWQPGPGFRGEFRFVIVDSVTKTRKALSVVIL